MTRTQIMNLCHQWAERAKVAWAQFANGPFPSNTAKTDAVAGAAPPEQERAPDVLRPAPPAPRAPGLNGSPP
jgi:hypothetical protein